jgi:hypothetical protein
MITNVMIAAMAETNNASDHSLLWGYGIEFWDWLGLRALIWGAALGVIALALTAASAYILYRVADVAQKDLEEVSRNSAERIAANEAETKRAIADSDAAKEGTAKANERIAVLSTQAEQLHKDTAEANARALEARVELEKFRAPRTLSAAQQARLAEQMKPFVGVRFDGAWASLDVEIDSFFTTLEDALKKAGWVSVSFVGGGIIYGRDARSSVGMANAFGVVINIDPAKNPELMPAAYGLFLALLQEGIGVVFQPKVGFTSANADTIHILVGTKH